MKLKQILHLAFLQEIVAIVLFLAWTIGSASAIEPPDPTLINITDEQAAELGLDPAVDEETAAKLVAEVGAERVITWSLHSETGRYRPDFRWDAIQAAHEFASRYFNIRYVRTNNGRIKWIQSARTSDSPGWAWARQSEMRIWVTNWTGANFGSNMLACVRVAIHETGHLNRTMPGGPSKQHTPGSTTLMAPGSNTAYNFQTTDLAWWVNTHGGPYEWRPGAPRPASEPNRLAELFK
jgi:hypothetical protein